jgi:uncharacterized membrane protein HdeD (DUF308 family)
MMIGAPSRSPGTRGVIVAVDPSKISDPLAGTRRWLMPIGLLLILLGVVAAIVPFYGAIGAEQAIGWALGIAGAAQLFHAFRATGWGGFVGQLVNGAVFVVGGITLVAGVPAGAVSLSIVIVATFLAGGIMQIVVGFRLRPLDGWAWFLLLGALSLLVGVLVFNRIPSESNTSAALLVGIDLVATGFVFLRIHQLSRDDTPAVPAP